MMEKELGTMGAVFVATRRMAAELASFVESTLKRAANGGDWVRIENNRREIFNRDADRRNSHQKDLNKKERRVNHLPPGGPTKWEFSDLMRTMAGNWTLFSPIFYERRRYSGVLAEELKNNLRELADIRNEAVHEEFAQKETARFFELATRVLRGIGTSECEALLSDFSMVTKNDPMSFASPFEAQELTFGLPIARDKLSEVYAFDEHAYKEGRKDGPKDIDQALFTAWWEAYPSGFLCALQNDRPFGVVGFFPVTERWATEFLSGEIDEHSLKRSDIEDAIKETKKASSHVHWYFSGLSFKIQYQHYLPRILGYALLQWLHVNAVSIGDRNITIVSEGTTSYGERLLREFFRFSPAPTPTDKPRFCIETNIAGVRKIFNHPLFRHKQDLQEQLKIMT